jgi:LPLT family lysophospholipid transporter-like MFS transporter
MNGFHALLVAQFLSAFVDNMILFVAQAILVRDAFPGWYLQLVQATFLFAYILLSPWAGRIADRFAKRLVLIGGNVVKCGGVGLLLAGADPAIGYAVVGVGAVLYSPAKYGILPFLANSDQQLLQANAQVEGTTILAILAGAVAGGWLADHSIILALTVCILFYVGSATLCLGIPSDPYNSDIMFRNAIPDFLRDLSRVLQVPRGRFSLLGTGGFWMASAVLRLAVFSWLPVAFGIRDNTTIGLMITLSGVGLVVGAALTPRLIPVGHTIRVIGCGALMVVVCCCCPGRLV